MGDRHDVEVVEIFSNEFDANLAKSVLESDGLEAHLLADDLGGVYPMLQVTRGIRLVVPADELARARELLARGTEDDSEGSA